MFTPNARGSLSKVTGRDVHSRPIYAPAFDIPFAPVNLNMDAQKTSVRTDSSASRGAADELVAMHARILVPTTVAIAIGDRFSFAGVTYRINASHPRYSVMGVLDHLQCDMEVIPE